MGIVPNRRYVQIAFNHSTSEAQRVLRYLPPDPRIIIEAGTPFCKREGMNGVRYLRQRWNGLLVADLKITDGAAQEVLFASAAGANAITCMGSAPTETLDLFCNLCRSRGVYSMIDMLGVTNPLRKLMPMKQVPDFVVIHKGRDEEKNSRKMIRYKDISKIRGKYDVLISVAGGLIPTKIRSAFFNGADVAILNVILPYETNEGVPINTNWSALISDVLKELGR